VINTFELDMNLDFGSLGVQPVSVIGKVTPSPHGEYLTPEILAVSLEILTRATGKPTEPIVIHRLDVLHLLDNTARRDIEEALEGVYRKIEHLKQIEPAYDHDEVG
jgi:hypothetical protein